MNKRWKISLQPDVSWLPFLLDLDNVVVLMDMYLKAKNWNSICERLRLRRVISKAPGNVKTIFSLQGKPNRQYIIRRYSSCIKRKLQINSSDKTYYSCFNVLGGEAVVLCVVITLYLNLGPILNSLLDWLDGKCN